MVIFELLFQGKHLRWDKLSLCPNNFNQYLAISLNKLRGKMLKL